MGYASMVFGEEKPMFDPKMALYDVGLHRLRQQQAQRWMQANANSPESYGTIHKECRPVARGPGARRQLDAVSICLAIAVPCAIFVGAYWPMAFSIFYEHPFRALLIESILAIATVLLGIVAAHKVLQQRRGHERTWFPFVFTTSLIALALGCGLGYLNQTYNTDVYYDYVSLRKLVDTNPGQVQGQAALDAGEIDFQAGVHVDTSLNSLYHKGQQYCVAPIVSPDTDSGGNKLASYDFWAVGMGCCSDRSTDFTCGDVTTKYVHKGLRVMDSNEIQGYMVAVEMAQSKYKIQALQPIFLYWLDDPYAKIRSYYDRGMTVTTVCMVCFLVIQVILVACQAAAFGIGAPSGHLDVDKGVKMITT